MGSVRMLKQKPFFALEDHTVWTGWCELCGLPTRLLAMEFFALLDLV